jgi:hypothetical protein
MKPDMHILSNSFDSNWRIYEKYEEKNMKQHFEMLESHAYS